MNLRPLLVIFISCFVKWFQGAKVDIPCGRRMIPKSVQSDNGSVLNRYRRIVDGDVSHYGQWPWIVSLKNPMLKSLIQRYNPKHMNWSLVETDSHICGGTLINDKWIVTARHCLYYSFSPLSRPVTSSWSATMGDVNLNGKSVHSVNIPVDKVIFEDEGFGNPGLEMYGEDFALMHLIRPANFTDYISPACLPDESLETPGRVCYTLGWGSVHSGRQNFLIPILKHATMVIVSRAKDRRCISQMSKEICTMPLSGLPCKGDSGGPLLCQRKNEEWVFTGINVRGTGCQKSDRDIFTSVYHHLNFIFNTITVKDV